LAYPNIAMADLARVWPELQGLSSKIAQQLEIEAKYDVYMQRQAADVASYRRDESFELPNEFDYSTLPGLSNEARHKLTSIRPRTIGQAGRIDGMTPAALTLLVAHARRSKRKSL
jgi:tRNA uridine 5-carboxymethylaminomethyl modification enzyme